MKEQSLSPDVISWPAGSTYEIILETHVHAHPATDGFRTKYSCPFVTFREKGGFMHELFMVASKVVCDPRQIETAQFALPSDDFRRLKQYVEIRGSSEFGFSSDGPYVFYLLNKVGDIKQPFAKPGLQGHTYYYLEDVPLCDKEENTIEPDLPIQDMAVDTNDDQLMGDRLGVISIESSPTFDYIYEVINACTGRKLKGYQQASYPLNSGFHLWFPKLPMLKGGRLVPWSTVKSWINELSSDGKEICMRSDYELVDMDNVRKGRSLWITFAKASPDAPYRYIGTFCPDIDRSTEKGLILTRVADCIDLSGIDL